MQENIQNRTIFCHDNLDVLRGIDSGTIDLIYLDPPFNKKKVFSAPIGSSAEGAEFSDIFTEKDVKEEWLESIKQDNEKLHNFFSGIKNIDGRRSYNFCYIAYMAIRLIECHRVLNTTGSLYLHCDQTMSHYIKIMMDCIFGEKQFRNEIVWKKYAGVKNYAKSKLTIATDSIFYYAKTKNTVLNPIYEKSDDSYIKAEYKYEDENGVYALLRGRNYQKTGKPKKKYLTEFKGSPITNLWMGNDVTPLNTSSKERTGYPTQKPLALLERIIKASSNEGGVVLDPFCGCATTCVAAERLDRKWIGVDISFKAYDLVRERLSKEVHPTLFEVDKKPHFYTYPPARTDNGTEYQQQKHVYVVSNIAYPDEYKVGIAKDINQRITSYQTSDPNRGYKKEYSVLTPHYRALEKHIHTTFENKHEWVRADLKSIKDAIHTFLENL